MLCWRSSRKERGRRFRIRLPCLLSVCLLGVAWRDAGCCCGRFLPSLFPPFSPICVKKTDRSIDRSTLFLFLFAGLESRACVVRMCFLSRWCVAFPSSILRGFTPTVCLAVVVTAVAIHCTTVSQLQLLGLIRRHI